MPTVHGEFTIIGYRDHRAGVDHIALVLGDVTAVPMVPVRAHSECLTGEAFASQRCDCGDQLTEALRYIAHRGYGAVIYLRGHEGRGIGIVNKIRAYALQDDGLDTVRANTVLGLPVDARDYSVVAHILADLAVTSVELLTNNPDKVAALIDSGVRVERQRQSHPVLHPANKPYLMAKRDLLGHAMLIGDD